MSHHALHLIYSFLFIIDQGKYKKRMHNAHSLKPLKLSQYFPNDRYCWTVIVVIGWKIIITGTDYNILFGSTNSFHRSPKKTFYYYRITKRIALKSHKILMFHSLNSNLIKWLINKWMNMWFAKWIEYHGKCTLRLEFKTHSEPKTRKRYT